MTPSSVNKKTSSDATLRAATRRKLHGVTPESAGSIRPRKIRERTVQPIVPLDLKEIVPAQLEMQAPQFEWVRPDELLVDASYQRDLSSRSLELIRRIIATWSWHSFKPPVVARTPEGLEIIDGQHTAIAALSHPQISEIPVMVIEVAERSSRAAAFISHNRDRIAITRLQMHSASVVAGEESAQTMEEVCRDSGIELLRSPRGNDSYNPGETIAVGSIQALLRRRGAQKALRVLEICRASGCAPVTASMIKAVELLLYDDEFSGKMDPSDITLALQDGIEIMNREVKLFAATHRIPNWRALSILIFRKKRRGS